MQPRPDLSGEDRPDVVGLEGCSAVFSTPVNPVLKSTGAKDTRVLSDVPSHRLGREGQRVRGGELPPAYL